MEQEYKEGHYVEVTDYGAQADEIAQDEGIQKTAGSSTQYQTLNNPTQQNGVQDDYEAKSSTPQSLKGGAVCSD